MTILEFLENHNIPLAPEGHHHITSSAWAGVDCPHCSPNSGRFRMGINLVKFYASCWTCGSHKLLPALAELTGESHQKIRSLLDWGNNWIDLKKEKVKGKLIYPNSVGNLLSPHRKYLKKRGFDPDHIAKFWGVKGIGLASKLYWRLFIPIHLNEEIVSWTTRAISNKVKSRYINAPSTDEHVSAKTLLYGIDHARHGIVIVEGCTDVWRIGPGAVATMGINYSQKQRELMINYPVRIICFDSESEAQRQARKLANDLAVFPGITKNIVLDAKDPGEANNKEIAQLRKFLD